MPTSYQGATMSGARGRTHAPGTPRGGTLMPVCVISRDAHASAAADRLCALLAMRPGAVDGCSGRWTLQRLLISLAFTSLFANVRRRPSLPPSARARARVLVPQGARHRPRAHFDRVCAKNGAAAHFGRARACTHACPAYAHAHCIAYRSMCVHVSLPIHEYMPASLSVPLPPSRTLHTTSNIHTHIHHKQHAHKQQWMLHAYLYPQL